MRIFTGIVALAILTAELPSTGLCLPQFSMLDGQKCAACHVNAQGGGLRTFRGWNSYGRSGCIDSLVGAIKRLYARDPSTNTVLNGRMLAGTDIRLQSARSHKSNDADRRIFPMQASLYSSFKLTDQFMVDGAYNFGKKKYFGQESFYLALVYRPLYSFTQLRIGHIRPSIGVKFDDHTALVRRVAGAYGSTMIPPYYAEWGAEYTYNGIDWLSLTGGIFSAHNIAENQVTNKQGAEQSLIGDSGNPSFLGRIELRRNLSDHTLTLMGGTSHFANGDFMLADIFAGAGYRKRISLLLDYAASSKKNLRDTHSLTGELTVVLKPCLSAFIRAERGSAHVYLDTVTVRSYTNSTVVGFTVFVLPYVELRPEYRREETQYYRSSRYALQLHLFR